MLHESALRPLSIQAARVGAHEARVAVLRTGPTGWSRSSIPKTFLRLFSKGERKEDAIFELLY